MKRVIMTGASGFVGANLAEKLVGEGHDVHLLLRDGYQPWRIEHLLPHLHLHMINLVDREGVAAEIQRIRPEWVFHLAAFGAYSWQDDATRAVNTNYLGTINLVEACMKTGFEAFINSGSSSEYGSKDHAPAENEYLEPNSYYAATKAAATLFCRYTGQRFNSPIFTLRLYSVYGAFEDPRRLIPTVIIKGLEGEFPPLVDPGIARDFVFVQDVVDAYLLAATSAASLPPGEVYNAGTGEQTSIKNVIESAREILNIKTEPVWGSMSNRSWDSTVWVAENHKLCSIGWKPQHDFQAGFQKTITWFRQNPALVEKIYRQA
jgi:nucleoside-diphosphate-sugar epimerase